MVSRLSPSDRRQREQSDARGGHRVSGWDAQHKEAGAQRCMEDPSNRNLIYGRNPVQEALGGRRRVYVVFLATGGGRRELQQACLARCADLPDGPPPVRQVSPEELTARLRTSDHQGIAAEVGPYPYVGEGDILRSCNLLIALDGVQDPHNLGAVIRTAEGAGAGVVIPRHRAAEVTGAVVKASAGATEHAAVSRVRNLADFLVEAKDAGFWVYGAAADAASVYTEQDYQYPTVFVLGSEGKGLGHRVASFCDVTVRLPLKGRVSSLNVSVSAGIFLYEAMRQRSQLAQGGLKSPRT